MSDKLNPCKCGHACQSFWRVYNGFHMIVCNNIFCSASSNGVDKVDAVRNWNKWCSNE